MAWQPDTPVKLKLWKRSLEYMQQQAGAVTWKPLDDFILKIEAGDKVYEYRHGNNNRGRTGFYIRKPNKHRIELNTGAWMA